MDEHNRAVGYARRSEPSRRSKDHDPISLEQQEAAIRVYAERTGLTVVAMVVHDGISGGRRDRYDELWRTVKAVDAHAVVAYHFDRLGRDLEHLLAFRKRCDQARIAVHLIGNGPLEPISSSRGFVDTAIHGLMAHHYRLLVAEKTRDALAQLRHQHRKWWGGSRAPYGWQAGPDKSARNDPAEATLLERLAELDDPALSLRALARRLSDHGILARCGRPFSPSVLWRLRRRRLTPA